MQLKLKYLSDSGDLSEIEFNCHKDAKVIVVEGFESVGKTHFINNLVTNNNNLKAWSPRKIYDLSSDSTEVVPYEHRYVLNLALIDLAKSGLLSDEVILVDRGLISGVVYSLAKSQDNQLLNSGFLKIIRDLYSSDLVHNVYIKHTKLSRSEELYMMSKNDSSVKESYDKFKDFDEYVEEYNRFDRLYCHYLEDLCGDNYTTISSENYNVIDSY